MNRKIKRKWLAALRGGAYEQAHGHLHVEGGRLGTEPGYCCLGVLCDIAAHEGVVPALWNDRSGLWSYGANTETSFLPAEVTEWAGLPSSDPVVPAPVGTNTCMIHDGVIELSALNDDMSTFAQIADLIEKHL